MVDSPSPEQFGAGRLGATAGKLAVIAILAAALIALLVFPSGGKSAPSTKPSQQTTAPPPNPQANSNPPPTQESAAEPNAAHSPAPSAALGLPVISLDEASEHDPFAAVPALTQQTATNSNQASDVEAGKEQKVDREEQVKQAVAAIRTQGVQMVLLGKNENLAIIGNRRVRVGDQLGGLRVTSITSKGITLSDAVDERE